MLPLHLAARYQHGAQAVALAMSFMTVFSRGAEQKTAQGRQLPLHIAAEHQKGEHGAAIIKALLEAYPRGASRHDKLGMLPLHIAAQHQDGEQAIAIVTSIINAYPQGVEQKTPGESIMVSAMSFMTFFPRGAEQKTAQGRQLPLHIAAEHQKGEHGAAIINALLEAYPRGASRHDKLGMLPLHIAAQHQTVSGAAVVTALLKACPESAQHKINGGCLPLHIAVQFQKGDEGFALLTALLAAYPEGAAVADKEGRLPLHFVALGESNQGSLAIATALLEAHPRGAQETDRNGCLPLHTAARHQKGEHGAAVMTALLKAYPRGGQKKDRQGLLPMDIAKDNDSLTPACVLSLRQAAVGQWQPPVSPPPQPVTTAAAATAPAATQLTATSRTARAAQPSPAVATRSRTSTTWTRPRVPAAPAPAAPAVTPRVASPVFLRRSSAVTAAAGTGPTRLTSAYAALASQADAIDMATPAGGVTLDQLELVARRACILVEHSDCSSTSSTLATLAAASAALAAEERLPASASGVLQAAPLLHDLLLAAQASHNAAPALEHLHALCAQAEDAAAHLRACHATLMSCVSAAPPPATVDAGLIAARDAALAAAQEASRVFSAALLAADMDAISAFNSAASDNITRLLQRVAETIGVAADTVDSASPGSTESSAATNATAASESFQKALTRLDGLAFDVSIAAARLTSLAPITMASHGQQDTTPSRTALATMRETTHSLFEATGENTLMHYLTHEAPCQTACVTLAARSAVLSGESDTTSGLTTIAAQLQSDTAAWSAALAEREAKITALKSSHTASTGARNALQQAIKKDQAPEEDSSEDDSLGVASAATASADVLRAAQQASRRACVARDAAANDLFALALAYYPETIVKQRKRLLPGGFPVVLSQLSLDDYENVKTLERAGDSRHKLLRATFDGEPCVLKEMSLSAGHSLVREADILKQVDHPNIVKLLAVFVASSSQAHNHIANAYLHMAHARHGDLEQFLTIEAAGAAAASSAAVLPARQLQRLARQLCEAVGYLAERSIVHCDVKPANVFVDGNRDDDSLRAILGDFDVSQSATGRTTTLTRAVVGATTHYTPGYAPPEVLHAPPGQPARASPAIDLYGLGCVIFAMHMFPRMLPEPASLDHAVASTAALFSPTPLAQALTPAVTAWAERVPRDLVQATTIARPRARASARELLHTRYMLDASGSFAHVAIQRPAYWLHQTHTGAWLEEETSEDVVLAVEKLLNATADPTTHGIGRDSHKTPFQEFKVTRVQRLEHPAVWSAYAARRRQVADALVADGYNAEAGIRPLLTETDGFIYPLEGGSRDAAAGEVFLFHGSSRPASIANSGFDVRYAFAGSGRSAMFGRGVYFAESASKADQYVGRDGGSRPLTMVVARVLLGRTAKVTAPRSRAPFLPEVEGRSTADVPVYYDSIVADMRNQDVRDQGMRFREVVVGDGSSAYPELFVEYKRVSSSTSTV